MAHTGADSLAAVMAAMEAVGMEYNIPKSRIPQPNAFDFLDSSPPPAPVPQPSNAPSSPSSLVSFPPESTRRILECPHILASIIAYAPTATQAACLRVSRKMYEATGRALYFTVRIDGGNMAAFFRGALIGTPHSAQAKKTLAKCTITHQEELRGKSSEDWLRNAIGQELYQQQPNKTTLQTKGKNISKGKKSRGNTKKGKNKPSPGGNHQSSNLKAGLLKHVRVLTISSHHRCPCQVYGPLTEDLLPNLEVVRIAPEIMDTFTLFPLCDRPGTCALLANVRAHKLVLRNLDSALLALETWSDAPKICNQLTVFLPTSGSRYDMGAKEALAAHLEMGHDFPGSPDTKVIFYPTWEGANETEENFGPIHSHAPVTPDHIVFHSGPFLSDAEPEYVMYGLCMLHMIPEGDLVRAYRRYHSTANLDHQEIVNLIRTELRTSSLYLALGTDTEEVNFEDYDPPGYPETIKYRTLNDYLKDTKNRRAEVNADD